MSKFNIDVGMVFKSYKEFSDFVGYGSTNSRSELRSRLNHHCRFHKIGHKIIIDDVFDVDELYISPISEYLYNINEIVHTSTGDVKIINKYISKRKNGKSIRYYMCECCNDGFKYEISQYNLRNGVGCRVCRNQIIIKGVNDIATTRPEIAKLIVNDNDKYNYSESSRKKVLFKCPICGHIKPISINTVSKIGRVQCNKCSDGFSYPNKFVYNAISQVCNAIEPEKIFNWSDKKRYDLFLPEYNLIIENHGRFHYDKEVLLYDQQYEYTCDNDVYKEKLAMKNGIKKYIVIDCRESSLKWIKKSILHSELPQILGFCEDDINWNECDKYAHNSLLKRVYDLYISGIKNKKILSKEVGISYETCCKYLNDALIIFNH